MFNIKILNEMLTCLDFNGHISAYMAKKKKRKKKAISSFKNIFFCTNFFLSLKKKKKIDYKNIFDLTKNTFLQSYICKSQ